MTRLQYDDLDPQPPLLGGHADAILYPDDITMLTEYEQDEWRAELADRQARRRPPGFAPWPDTRD